MKRTLALYRRAFSGLPQEIWLLALIMLINRSGTMVIPFMTLYLTQELQFTLVQAGLVMSCFGLGSVLGTWMGGQLTDRFGHYYVQFGALLSSGLAFILLLFMKSVLSVALTVFVLSMLADAFRPASMASVAIYSRGARTTRAFSLIRMAINLGFSVGPAVGGLLAARFGYNWLFIVDGVTCIAAGFLLLRLLPNWREETATAASDVGAAPPTPRQSAYRDKPFLVFVGLLSLSTIVFVQLFFTLPVFFREELMYSESRIGLILAMNGLLIALVEMPLVYRLENSLFTLRIVSVGVLLIGTSFLMYMLGAGLLIATIIGIVLISIGEMLYFPFTNTFAVERSSPGSRGQYMGLYEVGFALANVAGPYLGMQIAARLGYDVLWIGVFLLCLLVSGGLLLLMRWVHPASPGAAMGS